MVSWVVFAMVPRSPATVSTCPITWSARPSTTSTWSAMPATRRFTSSMSAFTLSGVAARSTTISPTGPLLPCRARSAVETTRRICVSVDRTSSRMGLTLAITDPITSSPFGSATLPASTSSLPSGRS